MITEDYVSFETAKLLKEKGFDFCCEFQYINCSSGYPFLTDIRDDAGCYYKNSEIGQDEYSAPTLQMAMKWLREVHGLHIEIRITNHSISNLADVIKYYWIVFGAENAKWKAESTVYTVKAFDKYEEAAEASIKYCLENLI